VSDVVQDALPLARAARLRGELAEIQGYWGGKAVEKGIVTGDRAMLEQQSFQGIVIVTLRG